MSFSDPKGENGLQMETREAEFSVDELALLRNVIHALRNLRYGSVNLTVHDGRLVEIQKIEKIRMSGNKGAGAVESRNGF
jgi:hypothetical protein